MMRVYDFDFGVLLPGKPSNQLVAAATEKGFAWAEKRGEVWAVAEEPNRLSKLVVVKDDSATEESS